MRHSRTHIEHNDTMLTSSFTGVRVASKQTQSSKKINTEISARRTKASAPAKKSALKVRDAMRRIFRARSSMIIGAVGASQGVKVAIWRYSDGQWGLRRACDAARGARRGGARGGWMELAREWRYSSRADKAAGRRAGEGDVCVCVVLVD